jgi:hypothetical protein
VIAALLVASLVALHGPDGHLILIAPQHIVSLRAPRAREHFAPGTGCLLLTDDSKLVSVLDRCEDVRKMIDPK